MVIDWGMSLQLAVGDISMAEEMLDLLIKSFDEVQKRLNQAHEAGDLKAFQAVLHYLHGGVCHVGAPRLKGAVVDLQNNISTYGKNTDTERLYRALFKEMQVLQQANEQMKIDKSCH